MTIQENEELLRMLYCMFDYKITKLWNGGQLEIRSKTDRRYFLTEYLDKRATELICMWITENKREDAKKKPTLKEYISGYQAGAYHRFIFTIGNKEIDVIGISDFISVYNPDLLEEYEVVSVETKEEGSDCTNYECRHYLTLKLKETKNQEKIKIKRGKKQ